MLFNSSELTNDHFKLSHGIRSVASLWSGLMTGFVTKRAEISESNWRTRQEHCVAYVCWVCGQDERLKLELSLSQVSNWIQRACWAAGHCQCASHKAYVWLCVTIERERPTLKYSTTWDKVWMLVRSISNSSPCKQYLRVVLVNNVLKYWKIEKKVNRSKDRWKYETER